jgi:hypothetical protein
MIPKATNAWAVSTGETYPKLEEAQLREIVLLLLKDDNSNSAHSECCKMCAALIVRNAEEVIGILSVIPPKAKPGRPAGSKTKRVRKTGAQIIGEAMSAEAKEAAESIVNAVAAEPWISKPPKA